MTCEYIAAMGSTGFGSFPVTFALAYVPVAWHLVPLGAVEDCLFRSKKPMMPAWAEGSGVEIRSSTHLMLGCWGPGLLDDNRVSETHLAILIPSNDQAEEP